MKPGSGLFSFLNCTSTWMYSAFRNPCENHPSRWHASVPRLPPQEGFQSAPLKPPLRIPPIGTTGAAS
jgi:hypothetical protein